MESSERDEKHAEEVSAWEARQAERQRKKELAAEVERLEAEVTAAQAERDEAQAAVAAVSQEVETLREQATPEWRAARATELAQQVAELQRGLLDWDHRDAFTAMARQHGIKDKAVRHAWDALKSTHGYEVKGDAPNPIVMGKALEALKGSHGFMFDLPPAAHAHVLNGHTNGAPPRWTLEGFQSRFGQH